MTSSDKNVSNIEPSFQWFEPLALSSCPHFRGELPLLLGQTCFRASHVVAFGDDLAPASPVNNQGLCKFQGSNSSSLRQNLPLVFSNNDKMCRLEMIACSKAENRKRQLLRDDRQCLLGFACI